MRANMDTGLLCSSCWEVITGYHVHTTAGAWSKGLCTATCKRTNIIDASIGNVTHHDSPLKRCCFD